MPYEALPAHGTGAAWRGGYRCAHALCLQGAILIYTLVASIATAYANERQAAVDTPAEPAAAAKAGKTLTALRLVSPPRIDGILDDEAWRRAPPAGDFVQWEPDNMEPLSEQTSVQVAYDDKYLYVAVHCHESNVGGIVGPLSRRDESFNISTDLIGIGFDPRHDHLTGYVFMTNPSGVQNDFTFFADEQIDRDYDAVWEVRTQRTPDGWSAEFQIPFSQMRFESPTAGSMVWGFSIRRHIQRKGEYGEWTGRPRGERGMVSRWGHLVFPDAIVSRRRVELMPYVLARGEASSSENSLGGAGAGVDARIGIGTGSTLSATVNPDFGQVELDPAVLNLTVFETFFPEKRPFFLEDSRTFVPPYGLFQLFHSRRIGRKPDRFRSRVSGDIVSAPDQTSVLAAAKLTGKASGWTYGALSAVTAREYGRVNADIGAGLERRDEVLEPFTSHNVARVQRDILNGTSTIGAIGTAVVRERDADAVTGGVDYTIRWDRNRHEWNGHWAVTRAPGEGGTRTDVGGVTNLSFTRKHWGLHTHFDHFGANFRVTDLGFLRTRVDSNQVNVNLRLQQPDPGKVFRRVSGYGGFGQGWNGDQLVYSRFAYVGAGFTSLNFWNVESFLSRGFRTLDDVDTRGGPPIVKPQRVEGGAFIHSDSRKTWRLSLESIGGRDAAGGWSMRVGTTLRMQPSGRFQASAGPAYSFGVEAAQWIRNVDADGVTDHVYGTLRRDVLDLTLRAAYALHRDLSLQVYLQPFVAVGDYSNIRRLARPRSFEFEPAVLASDPDFNRKSLRGNVVLRWEYLRGSSLFLVWNVSTLDRSRPGAFTPWRDLGAGFGADGTHVVMMKASYWLGR